MRYYTFMIVLGFGTRSGNSFWPPAYRVDLRDRKTFVIASDDADYDDENENEMIQPKDLVDMESLEGDEQRYKPLHSHVERYNQRAARTATEFSEFLPYFQPNLEDIHKLVEEAKPFVAGFKHELDEYDFVDLEEHVLEAMRKKRTNLDASDSKTNIEQSIPAIPKHLKNQRKNKTLSIQSKNTLSLLKNPSYVDKSEQNTEIIEPADTQKTTIFQKYFAKYGLHDNNKLRASKKEETASLMLPLYLPNNETKRNSLMNKKHRGINSEQNLLRVDEDSHEIDESATSQLLRTVMYEPSEEEHVTDASESNDSEKTKAATEKPSTEHRISGQKDEILAIRTTDVPEEEVYDYESFKMEYYQQVDKARSDNKTLNYTESDEPEDTAQDALRKIVDFKKPKNCTKEELTQIGAKALECLVFDYKNARTTGSVKKILARTWTVIRVWICIYLCIALPCWCQKGWCCCCFRCGFCFPKEHIKAAKKYYAENPPGVLVTRPTDKTQKPAVMEFEPTLFEMEAYAKVESAIRNL